MEPMQIDQSLDDLIATKRRSRAAGRRKAATAAKPTAKRPAGPRKSVSAARPAVVPAAPKPAEIVGDKIVISNLPDDVKEHQIRELFQTTVGAVKSVSLAYNAKGKSTGVATVQFIRPKDANSAYRQYNKRMIDGKRAMKVEIIVDPTKTPPAPLQSRLGAIPKQPEPARKAVPTPRGAVATPKARARAPKKTKKERIIPTAESLDAEMADYQAQAVETV